MAAILKMVATLEFWAASDFLNIWTCAKFHACIIKSSILGLFYSVYLSWYFYIDVFVQISH